ncbi:MAG: hypothetical protein UY32_C0002G0043 [Candidatus Jorgensenbacteria bacterium GW2011_GWC1_48_8]|uniref:Polymerase nucleotidyl transferase domain-containing protein n=1 Tax=Candidatus Jorgensenbacteria bacterium GW2011_GWC1_48_8 TaxID=1618666 RepID=A0A0G1UYT5_9BACT|nr:MAG: hypothetical protein UY32_C0002G0043 [Candidatus Jorgensenbacteria bacterium GW2011_GWC1_48_8]
MRLRPVFSFIPFLDFVIVSGSLATGNVHENSDFDVIVGARKGKIFTVRAFCVFVFGILGLRRRGIDHKAASSDKVCFNHFVTPKAYRLSPPYNDYWVKLYQNLVPVYGREKAVRDFFRANDWALPAGRQGPRETIFSEKYWQSTNPNPAGGIHMYTTWILKTFFEFVLQGWILGRVFEKFVKIIELHYIKKGIKNGALGFKPRVRYGDDELEFHPDTARIEEMLKEDLRF